MTTTAEKLVYADRGLVDRRIFADQEIYQQELEQIFGRCWLFTAHESQIPRPNDFIANYMGEDPVLVTRDRNGKVHTFLNMCRHRGNRICRADSGNSPSFMCTYHGWTFATDGKLVGVPGYKEAYFEELDRSQWGLVEARTDIYKKLAFATWDSQAPGLLDYLGDAAFYMDMFLDRRAGGSAIMGGAHRWPFKCNWKMGADNFGGDGYHVPVSHGSVGAAGINSGVRSSGLNIDPNRVNASPGNGHGIIGGWTGNEPNAQFLSSSPEAAAYFQQHLPELEQRLGTVRMRQGGMGIGTVFPNFTWFGMSGCMIRNWHPRGPLNTEAWTYCITDAEAPQEVKDAIRRRLTLSFSPSGTFEQDDGNNFGQCSASGKFMIGKKYPMNIQLGMNHEWRHEAMPGLLGYGVSENNARAFYERWMEVMNAPTWSDIRIDPRTR